MPFAPSDSLIHGAAIGEDVRFGWIGGAFEAPHKDDHYIVEFLGPDNSEVRIIAYLDRFGRAFTTDRPLKAPPAREPDLAMASAQYGVDEGLSVADCPQGWFLARNAEGEPYHVADFRSDGKDFEVFNSWYDFGEFGRDLSYVDIMARVYLACIYRPSITGIPVPSSGLGTIRDLLGATNVLRGLRAIKLLIERADADPALRPPAAARLLARWLEEAGFTERLCNAWLWAPEGEEEKGPLRLIRTKRYANTFYLALENENSGIGERQVWAIESALNRFLLLTELLEGRESSASEEECVYLDEIIRKSVIEQAQHAEDPADAASPVPAGEWGVRLGIGRAMETLRLPYRYQATYHSDVADPRSEQARSKNQEPVTEILPGVVAFFLRAPDEAMMPAQRFDRDRGAWIDRSLEDRRADAFSYAIQLGVLLAAAAFRSGRAIDEVMVTARPFEDFNEDEGRLFYQVVFTRNEFCNHGAYRRLTLENPVAFLEAFEPSLDKDHYADPFLPIVSRDVQRYRSRAPELVGHELEPPYQSALGARNARDVRIDYNARPRHVADRIAEKLVDADSTQDAIRILREEQNATSNALVYEGCTNLMTALTQGSLDAQDRREVTRVFLGEDPYAQALSRARDVAPQDAQAAAAILSEAIAQAEASGRYVDTSEVVHRVFDTYAARLSYNLHSTDEGRTVELVPPTLLMCYLEALNLLDESFTQSEMAVSYGKRCIEIAPTFSVAYRRCARAYMLVGDLESASDLLIRCLEFTLAPEEIAMAYYQLAYVMWKAGRAREGLACYCKSIMISPVYAAQATLELRELMHEEGIDYFQKDEIDKVLKLSGIPLAPTEEALDELKRAIEASINANLFAVGRSLLALYLIHRPDDASANVLRSLEDPRIEALLGS